MAAIFVDENQAQGVPPKSAFQVGVSDFDNSGTTIESGVKVPVPDDENANWLYYDIAILTQLDSGIVVHRTLPQVDVDAATLASCTVGDKNIDQITGKGVNILSQEKFTDIVQRMGHARFWFCLFGEAMRIGQQVPIPGLKTVGGVPAIPFDENPQVAFNKNVGNYSGAILWYAKWELWYTVAVPPKAQQLPPRNLSQYIDSDQTLPNGLQAPFSFPDDEAKPFNPIPQNNAGNAVGG